MQYSSGKFQFVNAILSRVHTLICSTNNRLILSSDFMTRTDVQNLTLYQIRSQKRAKDWYTDCLRLSPNINGSDLYKLIVLTYCFASKLQTFNTSCLLESSSAYQLIIFDETLNIRSEDHIVRCLCSSRKLLFFCECCPHFLAQVVGLQLDSWFTFFN